MQGNYLSPIIDAFKPILIFAAVLWGIETIITMLIKDHKKAKRKQALENGREAISFNSDGFIGFCGWADTQNSQPFLNAFRRWLTEYMLERSR